MSSIVSNTKNLWRRSLKLKESPFRASDSGIKMPGEPVTVVVIGCGQRGKAYARYALLSPEACKIVAIAEPRPQTRSRFAAQHNVDKTLVFSDWKELHAASAETINTVGKRLADAVIICVQDHMHVEVAVAFAEQGYHILCEKPMATSLEGCIRMEEVVKKAGIIFGMGHVMRYSPYSQEITAIVQSGALGRLINIVQVEPVGHYHFAHSYVRGNWGKEKNSSFSLMTKSCHDIDIICHWMGSPAVRASSFGSLQHFRKSSKPGEAGTATRCLDCKIEKECPYSAKRIYLDRVSSGETGWPVSPLVDGIPDIENVTAALKTGPYGMCVYESENDVCDNQVVNLEFENGNTASFTMVAFTSAICDRQLRMHFSHGEIIGNMSTFTVTDFRTNKTTTHVPKNEGGGHGGGDIGLIRTFIEAVRTGNQKLLGTDVEEVLKSHMTVFAAETSRREQKVVNCIEFEHKTREIIQGTLTQVYELC
ncbi:NAD(P)-binding protein [Dendrothele bispora CBS 962.96]|uniref:NAD(P)-binding protein n=1 Tax=Dendrothele bispora (strain CBS 962.96) TaxID=1314807 RepID=A0A4S8MZ19_DENBC|nr:NAD(P)-binding protein [Dendrothele bispora CBS 962.96]